MWYPGDWRKDPGVHALDYYHRGVWFEILMLMHEGERRGMLTLNGKAMPMDALAQILGIPKTELEPTVNRLVTYGVASIDEETGALCCRRMLRDEAFRSSRARNGAKGGRPPKTEREPTGNLDETPSVSVSSSLSLSTTEQQNRSDGVVGSNGYSLEQYFATFYKSYPRKVGKPAALRAWRGVFNGVAESKWSGLFQSILKALGEHKKQDQWTKDDGRFIPHPSTWLNQHRWEDELPGLNGRVRGAERGESFKGIEDANTFRTEEHDGGDRVGDEETAVGRLSESDLKSSLSNLLETPKSGGRKGDDASDV
jgi:hypothetical protein